MGTLNLKLTSITIALAALALFTGCADPEGGVRSDNGVNLAMSTSPAEGTYFATIDDVPHSTQHVSSLKLGLGNQVALIDVFTPQNGESVFRKTAGTFKRVGNFYSIEWTYKTCEEQAPVSFKLQAADSLDHVTVQMGSTVVQMLNINSHQAPVDVEQLENIEEDTDCNSPASSSLLHLK